jgi:hypothetical protein
MMGFVPQPNPSFISFFTESHFKQENSNAPQKEVGHEIYYATPAAFRGRCHLSHGLAFSLRGYCRDL